MAGSRTVECDLATQCNEHTSGSHAITVLTSLNFPGWPVLTELYHMTKADWIVTGNTSVATAFVLIPVRSIPSATDILVRTARKIEKLCSLLDSHCDCHRQQQTKKSFITSAHKHNATQGKTRRCGICTEPAQPRPGSGRGTAGDNSRRVLRPDALGNRTTDYTSEGKAMMAAKAYITALQASPTPRAAPAPASLTESPAYRQMLQTFHRTTQFIAGIVAQRGGVISDALKARVEQINDLLVDIYNGLVEEETDL